MAFDFDDYLSQFNTLSEEDFARRFYTEDLTVESQFGLLTGRDNWVAVLNDTHIGIREELKPLAVAREGDIIMAELIGTFTATADKPDFAYGPLRQGESVDVRFFARYHVAGERIDAMAMAWWNPIGDIRNA